MIEAWPDDVDVAIQRHFLATTLALGAAVCTHCGKVHEECGRQHLQSPWIMPPRCIDCGTILELPEHQQPA